MHAPIGTVVLHRHISVTKQCTAKGQAMPCLAWRAHKGVMHVIGCKVLGGWVAQAVLGVTMHTRLQVVVSKPCCPRAAIPWLPAWPAYKGQIHGVGALKRGTRELGSTMHHGRAGLEGMSMRCNCRWLQMQAVVVFQRRMTA